jgi:ADP-ribose pyrophosphatase
MWRGKYVTAIKDGRWEYVERTGRVAAAVILAEYEGQVVLVEQPRVPTGRRCLELPAGLVGDVGEMDDVETAARRELEEETGFRAERIELLGEFYSAPGILAESFTLVRASGLTRVGPGGGVDGEDIVTHLVPRNEIAAFVAAKRAEGVGVDAKVLLVLAASLAP